MTDPKTGRLARLREIESAMTPGPWPTSDPSTTPISLDGSFAYTASGQSNIDLKGLCAARNALPALLAVAEAARKMASACNGTDSYERDALLALEAALDAADRENA